MQEPKEKRKPTKRQMTDKQKVARLANLERGRKKRLESLQQKKEAKEKGEPEEYDLSSDDSESTDTESDADAFIISKKKKSPAVKSKKARFVAKEKVVAHDHLRTDVDELKDMVMALANLQKKQTKTARKQNRKPNATKIVVLPQNTSGVVPTKGPQDSLMEALRKSLM